MQTLRLYLAITEKQPENVAIDVWPNPANEAIYIKISDPTHTIFDVSVFNSSGQIVQKIKDFSSDNPFIVNELRNGVYFIRLSNGQKTGFKSFVVAR